MPSIHKVQGTPYWHCFFYLPDGRRTHRSSGTSDKRKGLPVCMKMAEASSLAKEGRLIEARARATIADIVAVVNSEALPSAQVKAYLHGWIDRKRLEIAENSASKYERIVDDFIAFLGARANRPMDEVTVRDVAAYRDHLAKRVTGATVNKTMKILRSAWTRALAYKSIRSAYANPQSLGGLPKNVVDFIKRANADVDSHVLHLLSFSRLGA